MWCAGCAVSAERAVERAPTGSTTWRSASPPSADACSTTRPRSTRTARSAAWRRSACERPARRRRQAQRASGARGALLLRVRRRLAARHAGDAALPAASSTASTSAATTTTTTATGLRAAGRPSSPRSSSSTAAGRSCAGAWRAARARTVTMDTLIALGTLIAYADSVVVAVTASGPAYFDAVAHDHADRRARPLPRGRRRRAGTPDLHRLLALQPERARGCATATAGGTCASSQASPGDELLVRPGERVPLDAVRHRGRGRRPTSRCSPGEARPVAKAAGDDVYAGTVLVGGALVCRVLARHGRHSPRPDHRCSWSARCPPSRRSSAWPTGPRRGSPSSSSSAAAVTVAAWLALGHSPAAVIAGVAVLVVACPCALGLATPLVLALALGRAVRARRGRAQSRRRSRRRRPSTASSSTRPARSRAAATRSTGVTALDGRRPMRMPCFAGRLRRAVLGASDRRARSASRRLAARPARRRATAGPARGRLSRPGGLGVAATARRPPSWPSARPASPASPMPSRPLASRPRRAPRPPTRSSG